MYLKRTIIYFIMKRKLNKDGSRRKTTPEDLLLEWISSAWWRIRSLFRCGEVK